MTRRKAGATNSQPKMFPLLFIFSSSFFEKYGCPLSTCKLEVFLPRHKNIFLIPIQSFITQHFYHKWSSLKRVSEPSKFEYSITSNNISSLEVISVVLIFRPTVSEKTCSYVKYHLHFSSSKLFLHRYIFFNVLEFNNSIKYTMLIKFGTKKIKYMGHAT